MIFKLKMKQIYYISHEFKTFWSWEIHILIIDPLIYILDIKLTFQFMMKENQFFSRQKHVQANWFNIKLLRRFDFFNSSFNSWFGSKSYFMLYLNEKL
jgi:hypothetical protein